MFRHLGVSAVLAVSAAVAVSSQIVTGQTVTRSDRPGFPPPRDAAAAAPAGTARVGGRVFSAAQGSPLRRAQVTIASQEAGVRRMTTTDADGRYEFAELPAGRYTVTAAKGGYVTLQAGQRRPFEPGTPIAVGAGQRIADLDLALPRGSVIAGRVTDEFGEPLAVVQVQARRYQYGPGGRRRLVNGGGPFVLTDDLGQFRVYGLMPGEYVLSAMFRPQMGMAVGRGSDTDSSEGYAPTFYPGTANPAEAQPVTLGLGQEVLLHIAMTAARMARISGSVVDSAGRPAAGAMIIVRSGISGIGMMAALGGRVAADGTFTLANTPPGEHVLEIRRPPREPGASGEFASVPMTVGGEDITGLRLTMSQGATVRGRVVFDGAASRSGGIGPLRVFAQSSDPEVMGAGMMFGGGAMSNGAVGEDGTFELRGLTGTLLLRVAAPPDWTLKAVLIDGEDVTDREYDFSGAQTLSDVRVILTDRLTEISGGVTDDRGRALKDYVVVLLPGEPIDGAAATRFTRTVRPDQEGRFRLRGLPPGRYVAAAVESLEQGGEWSPLFQLRVRDVARPVVLAEGRSIELDLELARGL